jgi:hypothetical protein
MTLSVNPSLNMMTDNHFMEPSPVVIVADVDAVADYTNIATLCDYSDANIHDVVCAMFDKLLGMSIMFDFEPLSATWSCSYFPANYITEVVFNLCLRQQNNMLLIEKQHISGHRETYSSLCNELVSEVIETISPVNH